MALEARRQGNAVRVSVRDTGEGISEVDRERIFEKFGQVGSRKSGRTMSTGLGLTFCKLAVEAHGGTIGVVSILGEGSTFWFSLPMNSDPNQAAMLSDALMLDELAGTLVAEKTAGAAAGMGTASPEQ